MSRYRSSRCQNEVPEIPVDLYAARLERLRERMDVRRYAPGSTVELRSGMAFQVDIIPATGTPFFTTNVEDGLALADPSLREAFATAFPGAWARIQARRAFMRDGLGIDLHPDVLPFSNIPAYLSQFLLRPDRAMTLAG